MYFGGGFPLVNGLPPLRSTWKISGVTDCALNRLSLSLCLSLCGSVSCRCTPDLYIRFYIYIHTSLFFSPFLFVEFIHFGGDDQGLKKGLFDV